jgi:hypothetical protein
VASSADPRWFPLDVSNNNCSAVVGEAQDRIAKATESRRIASQSLQDRRIAVCSLFNSMERTGHSDRKVRCRVCSRSRLTPKAAIWKSICDCSIADQELRLSGL